MEDKVAIMPIIMAVEAKVHGGCDSANNNGYTSDRDGSRDSANNSSYISRLYNRRGKID